MRVKRHIRIKKQLRAATAILLVIALLITTYRFFFPTKTQAAWWDENWMYRQIVAISNSSGSTQTDYQVQITMATNSLYSAGKIQGTCADIRVVQVDTGKILPYWIEPGTCNTASTLIWTKIPSIPTTGVNLYVYYGNPSAASQSSTTSTFIREISNAQAIWKMDENTGSTANDSSGNTNTGTITNGSWTTGKYSYAVAFNNTSTQFRVPNAASIQSLGTGSFSLDTWFYWNGVAASDQDIIALKSDSWQFDFADWGSGDTIEGFVFTDATDASSYANISPSLLSGWHHLVTTYSNSGDRKIYMYIDGAEVSYTGQTAATGTAAGDSSDYLFLGCQGSTGNCWGSYYDGNLDETHIYNKVLSSAEITDLANNYGYATTNYPNYILVRKRVTTEPAAGSPSTEEQGPGPVAYWKLDAGYGQTVNDATQNADNGTLGANSSANTDDPSWATEDMCVSGKCLKFTSSSSQYVNVSTSIAGVKSVSFWVRPTSVASISIAVLNGATGNASVATDGSGNLSLGAGFPSPTCYLNGAAQSSCGATTLIANQWNHVVITTSSGITASNVMLGRVNTGYLNGFMDEVKLYQYARSAAQVKADYASRGSVNGASANLGLSKDNNLGALSNGLVGYWKTDESSGNASDSSGNALTLTNNSAMVYAAGKFGNAAQCDGSADYLNTATAINGVKTVSFYAYPAAAANNYFINLINSSAYITINSSGVVSATGFTSPSIYVNGVLNGTVSAATWSQITVTSDTPVNANAFAVGLTNDGSNHFCTSTSKIDEVRIYNRMLSPAEVTQLYNWAPGPVGWWKLDENTGTSANDSSGNGSTGTITTGTGGFELGKYGGAYRFDNADTSINCGSPTVLNDLTVITVEAWINPAGWGEEATNGWGRIFDKSYKMFYLTNNENGFNATLKFGHAFSGNTGYWFATSNILSLNTWQHVAVTYNSDSTSNTPTFYVNGIPYGATLDPDTGSPSGTASSDAASTLYLGNSSTPSRTFNGKIDDVRIYDYARTQKQIVEDMNAGHPAPGSPVGSPVGYWKFDEGYGTGAAGAHNSGSAGTTLDGTLSGATVPSWTNSGKFGKALSFNGTSAYVAMPSDAAALKITGDLTLSAWINLSNVSSTHDIICKYTGTAATSAYCLSTNTSGNLVMSVVNATGPAIVTTTGTKVLATSTWYHVVGVFSSASSVKLYVNGLLDTTNTTSIPTTLQNPTTVLDIGAENAGSNLFTGSIDEAKIYNFALTADEVKMEYNRSSATVLGTLSDNSSYEKQAANQQYCVPGDSASCAPPVGEWKMDENSGTSTFDTSGNGNTGTLYNTVSWKTGKFGSAIYFDGGQTADGDSHVRLADNFFDSNTQGTISFWFKPDTSGDDDKIIFGATEDDNGAYTNFLVVDYTTSTNKIGIAAVDNNTYFTLQATTPAISNPTGWHHVAVTMNSSGNTIYVDGVKQTLTYIYGSASTDVWFDNIAENTTAYTIGCYDADGSDVNDCSDDTRIYQGYLDNLTVYNYARTPAQIAWDYNRGAPVAWYKMDECTGSTVYNAALNGNGTAAGMDGTLSLGSSGQTSAGNCVTNANTAWYNGRNGKFNSSLNFDGSDDYVSIADNDAFSFGNSTSDKPFSVSAWVNMTDATSFPLITKSANTTAGSPEWLFFSDGDDKLNLQLYDLSWSNWIATRSVSVLTSYESQWINVAAVYDGSGINGTKLYLNGLSIPTSTESQGSYTAMHNTSTSLYIGTVLPDDTTYKAYAHGQIDDVRIYNYALTATQIKTLYNQDSAIRYGPSTGSP
jgi:hypothetical protein